MALGSKEETTIEPKKGKSKPPVARVKVGFVEAAVWLNEGEKGEYNSITFKKNYKKGENWKETNAFMPNDLEDLIRTAEKALELTRPLKVEKE